MTEVWTNRILAILAGFGWSIALSYYMGWIQ